MARVDDLVQLVSDSTLRQELAQAVADLKRRRRFGLVFEQHIPETATLLGGPLRPGAVVQRRDDPSGKRLYRITELTADGASIVPLDGNGHAARVSSRELLAVTRLGEPIYPGLTSVGVVERGGQRPYHAVINGENYHALQLLISMFEGQVDAIYIDPPYNTGAKDWKYNNSYVDDTDQWRHSKWLSFMDRRLRLARRLLRPDGVLIVTVDEHEILHLGMLLEQVMPDYLRYQVTIIINPKGTYKANFARVEEYAFFCVPDIGTEVITGRPAHQVTMPKIDGDGDRESKLDDDEPTDEGDDADADERPGDETKQYEYWHLRRRGEESNYRHQRPNQFYAILVDERERKAVGVGPTLGRDDPYEGGRRGGLLWVYPIDGEGNERVWRYAPDTMREYIAAGEIVVGRYNPQRDTYTLNHRKLRKAVTRLKTVWTATEYDAGVHGTNVLKRLLGRPGLFPFPKSVYAVRDALAAVCRNRPDALIVDFFAGSGTTFHAAALLNAEDDGRRRCILVTNNEVDPKTARSLAKLGLHRGDPDFEAHGIFEQVTRPRCEAVVTGLRPDGTPIPGAHVGGRPLARGFPENVEFFRLDYLDRDEVDLGLRLDAVLPALWLAAGGVGPREVPCDDAPYSVPDGARYAMLLRQSRFRQFRSEVERRPDITHAYLVTDSEEAFAEMRSELPGRLSVGMLYGDYLRSFLAEPNR